MKNIRLTGGMLRAMLAALCEMLAGEGRDEKTDGYAERARQWIHQELQRRGLTIEG